MATGLRALLAVLFLCSPLAVTAEFLPDPTRPAIDLSGKAGDGMPVSAASQGLQSIIISPQYRAAVINGETVRLGGKSGGYRLLEVNENSVVLQNSQGRRVMELFPRTGIKKNDVAQHEDSHTQEEIPGEMNLPEKAVGGVK